MQQIGLPGVHLIIKGQVVDVPGGQGHKDIFRHILRGVLSRGEVFALTPARKYRADPFFELIIRFQKLELVTAKSADTDFNIERSDTTCCSNGVVVGSAWGTGHCATISCELCNDAGLGVCFGCARLGNICVSMSTLDISN